MRIWKHIRHELVRRHGDKGQWLLDQTWERYEILKKDVHFATTSATLWTGVLLWQRLTRNDSDP